MVTIPSLVADVIRYCQNIGAWVMGFARLNTLTYKPHWSPVKFLPLYLFDYGLNVVTGGACESLSRSWTEGSETNRVDSILIRIVRMVLGPHHGEASGPALWGTQNCRPWVRALVTVWWVVVVVLI